MGTDDHAFPVLDDGRLVGLVTPDDMRQVSRDKWNTTTAREIMTPTDELVATKLEEDAAEALNKLRRRDVRQLPVLREGNLAGLVRRRDISSWRQREYRRCRSHIARLSIRRHRRIGYQVEHVYPRQA